MPGDPAVEHDLRSMIRWNATALVLQANAESSELGGHIASYQSAATLYEVGFNHFWHAPSAAHGGDLVYIQGHSSPGVYARAFLEGRLTEAQMQRFRQETDPSQPGLSSYPHPWLMPDFWQFPTVSMGLGPLMAIHQAHFMKYLTGRGITDTSKRKVWAFMGDGEMDEPESMGAISLAGREKLDNLVFVINCNLQRLDGPVRGNGKIIQELETNFRGAGWNVIKVIWGSRWDPLLEADTDGHLRRRMQEALDGDYQAYKARDGAFVREHFFGTIAGTPRDGGRHERQGGLGAQPRWPRPAQGVRGLRRGRRAHRTADRDPRQDRQGLRHGQGRRGSEHHPSAEEDGRRRAAGVPRPLRPAAQSTTRFAARRSSSPDEDDPAIRYLRERRKHLGGSLPVRKPTAEALEVPELSAFQTVLDGSGEREISTTMAFVRVLAAVVRDKALGRHVVPIVADESRTFGMEGMFRQLGIFSQVGQLYQPEDSEQLMFYKEDKAGQILQEGINEAGAMSAWIAAATSYANHGVAMIPFYIYYSMFGFQRIGDLAWAAGDSRARGFLLGGHGRPHHAQRRGAAARGRSQPSPGADDPELHRLRPGLRLRGRSDHPGRSAAHGGRAGGRLLLRHPDERELPATRVAGGVRAGDPSRDAPHRATPGRPPLRCADRLGHDPARIAGCGADAGGRMGRRGRGLERHVLHRAGSRRAGQASDTTVCTRPASRRPRTSRSACPATLRSSRRPTTSARCPSRSDHGSPRRTRCWAPTDSVAATTASRCGGSSRWTASTSSSPTLSALGRAKDAAAAIEKYGIDSDLEVPWRR